MQQAQTVSEMAQEVLERQAKALAHRSGLSLEDARRAVADTQAGRQLRNLASGEHRHQKANQWQTSMFWERAEQRFMHQIGSEVLSRYAGEYPYSWLESYMERLEGKEAREHDRRRSRGRNEGKRSAQAQRARMEGDGGSHLEHKDAP